MLNVYEFLRSQGDEYKKLAFKDLLFVYYQCPQVDLFAKIYTHYNYIVYALRGKKIYHTPGQSFLLEEGDGAFVNKGGYQQERFLDLDWVVLAFFMPDNYMQQFMKENMSLLPLPAPQVPAAGSFNRLHINELTRSFFESILPYFAHKPGPPENVIELKFRELLLNLLSDPGNASVLNYLINLASTHKPLLTEVMEENFMHNLSLEEYARIAQRSLASFKREFAKLYDLPPGRWLTKKRIEYAQLLLRSPAKNINEIASDCGFESAAHFNRTFKQYFGLAPLRYRRRLAASI
jgi:AraC-like DNA-binding protein